MINHSDRFDPLCACALSSECNESFNFLASREQFDRMFGFAGWVLQHLGTYSVIRGRKVERASAEETVRILVQGKHKLAEFPEGDVTGRDDAILPLKEDGLLNLFEAQRQLLELTGESLFVLPVAMYYKVRHDSIKPMTECVNRLEKAFHISSLNMIELSFEQRIKRLVSQYISHLANMYNIVLFHKQSLSAELQELSRKITAMTANGCGITVHPDEDDAVFLYGIRADLRKSAEPCSLTKCEFKHKLQRTADSKRAVLIRDLDLAEQLLILASTLESSKFTPEVAWRVLDRLELEIVGKTTTKGHRTAWIEAAQPIDLAPIYRKFVVNEKAELAKIDQQVRAAIFHLIQNMQTTKSYQKQEIEAKPHLS
jgi:1-acyl-sn-glycerol-3-phosphate acyltransferase